MADFMIRFFLCNVLIGGIIGILLLSKWIFKDILSSRMQYNLWFLLLGLLAVPFIPFRPISLPQMTLWLYSLRNASASDIGTAMGEAAGADPSGNADWMNDFALSVSSGSPSVIGYILFAIWITGTVTMILLVIKSSLRLHTLENTKAALFYTIRKMIHGTYTTGNMPLYGFLQTPPIKYMMPYLPWRKVLLRRMTLSFHGMGKIIHSKHGMLTRPCSRP